MYLETLALIAAGRGDAEYKQRSKFIHLVLHEGKLADQPSHNPSSMWLTDSVALCGRTKLWPKFFRQNALECPSVNSSETDITLRAVPTSELKPVTPTGLHNSLDSPNLI